MRVKAKRLGWNEVLTPVQLLDMDPYDHEDDDLEGELVVREVDAPEPVGHLTLYMVDGQEADGSTIEYLE